MVAKKIAIVTGNYKGLGKRISETLTEHGYQQPDIIRRSDYDLRQPQAAEKLVNDTINKYGRLDLLVNNVGDFIHKNISDISISEWHEMMHSNLNSAFYMCHYALPHLRTSASSLRGVRQHDEAIHNAKHGDCFAPLAMTDSYSRILNIGYAGAEHFRTYPTTTAYQAAKTGLLVLTKGLAKAEAPNNILVNMLSPGHLENSIAPYNLENIGLGRLGTLDEACSTAMFLINHSYITGQNIEVAGGWGL